MQFKILTDRFLMAAAITSIFFVQGCGNGNSMAPVAGVVTIDGIPFTTGKVIFNPIAEEGEIEAGKSSFGKLNSDGRFVLSTNKENDGALVGKHRVTIFHSEDDSPYKFTRLTYPDSIFSVVAGQENEIEIALTAEQVKKYGNSK